MIEELVQTGTAPFDRFGDGNMFALRGYQDDATEDIPGYMLAELISVPSTRNIWKNGR